MDNVLHKICEMFHAVLAGYAEDGEFKTPAEVKTAKAAISGILKIKTLEAMEQYNDDHKSFRKSMAHDGMKEKLEGLMQEAQEHDKEIIKEMLSKM